MVHIALCFQYVFYPPDCSVLRRHHLGVGKFGIHLALSINPEIIETILKLSFKKFEDLKVPTRIFYYPCDVQWPSSKKPETSVSIFGSLKFGSIVKYWIPNWWYLLVDYYVRFLLSIKKFLKSLRFVIKNGLHQSDKCFGSDILIF